MFSTPSFPFEYSAKWKTRSWKTLESVHDNDEEKTPRFLTPNLRFWVWYKTENLELKTSEN